MQQLNKITLNEVTGELAIYFNWSANALLPITPGAADVYLKRNRYAIFKMAQYLLQFTDYTPGPIYRGIILSEEHNAIKPQKSFMYLSFSTRKSVAEHFANVNGFGSDIMNISCEIGTYGYVIEYAPRITEILFHYKFLSMLPYAEAFSLLNINGLSAVKDLEEQNEIIIFQPAEPFINITKVVSGNKE